MSALDVALRYFDGWNQHDAGFLVATFTAFPDLSFELAAAPVADADSVTARWIMRGTNTGPFGGGPATGRRSRSGRRLHPGTGRSRRIRRGLLRPARVRRAARPAGHRPAVRDGPGVLRLECTHDVEGHRAHLVRLDDEDRKSTRLNSSHGYISYAVFCLEKKKPTY